MPASVPDATAMMAYLKEHVPAIAELIEKDMTVSDVHQTSAIGNGKGKSRSFKAMLAEAKAKTKALPAQTDFADVEWSGTFKMAKADADKQIVKGWASVTHRDGELVVDKQDDVITSEDLEDAVHEFVLNCREQGDMHMRKGVGKLVESALFTKETMEECGLFAFDIVSGEQLYGWYAGFKVTDDALWKSIRAGEKLEFSIGGSGKRVAI